VRTNPKQRFSLDPAANRIRANQGHSVEVDLGLAAMGLSPMARRQVHLSADPETALAVGARHGAPVALVVDSGRMHADGYHFYCSVNGVWLTGSVPAAYLSERPS
jgi:putative RNA 2'-phosphotransferase